MAETQSIPGAAEVLHEAGDTFVRTLTISSGGVPIDFSSATVSIVVSAEEDGDAIDTLTVGNGITSSPTDLTNGIVKIFWQTAGKLEPRNTYYWKLKVQYSDNRVKTYIESKFKTV